VGNFTLPVDNDQVIVLGIMSALELEAASELSMFLDNRFRAESHPEWFEDIRHYRISMNQPFSYKSPSDLRFILGEAVLEDSQIWHQIPKINQAWVNAAHTLRQKLNLLHHQQLAPNLQTLLQISTLFDQVTSGPGLEVSNWARAVQSRVKNILAGNYTKPEAEPAPVIPAAAEEVTKEYEEVIRQREKRPPWGSRWTGTKPSRKLTLDRQTQDIYDDNGVSVAEELGDLRDQVMAMWLRYFPLGGEVWVDPEDGAAMGYIKGTATMVGWFGAAPEDNSDTVRGFVLAHEYEFTGSDVKDLTLSINLANSTVEDSSEALTRLRQILEPATRLNITDFGDLFVPVSEGEPKRIMNLHKNVWFKGQLPG
jgi:hypothetical protein